MSLARLEHIYMKLKKEISEADSFFLEYTYNKYARKANNFYRDRKNTCPAVIKKLDLFLLENNLIVEKADKNMNLTILDRSWYSSQIMIHLNSSAYRIEDSDCANML